MCPWKLKGQTMLELIGAGIVGGFFGAALSSLITIYCCKWAFARAINEHRD